MRHRDGIFAVLALALSSAALAGMVHTEVYSHAARAEANGYDALTQQVFGADLLLCEQPAPKAAR
jgi:hypothetical protein